VIGRANIGVEEEFSSVGVRPVFWEGVFGFLVVLDPFDKVFECVVLADEL
jgi:hypothetical protein